MKLAHCKACGDPVIWVVTQKGKNMPVDADPVVARSGFRLDEDGDQITAKFTPAPEPNEKVYVSHFSTCVHAEQHRR